MTPITQIDVAVNSPKAGKIVELLAKEEDTVTVGQDLFVLDTDASSAGSTFVNRASIFSTIIDRYCG